MASCVEIIQYHKMSTLFHMPNKSRTWMWHHLVERKWTGLIVYCYYLLYIGEMDETLFFKLSQRPFLWFILVSRGNGKAQGEDSTESLMKQVFYIKKNIFFARGFPKNGSQFHEVLEWNPKILVIVYYFQIQKKKRNWSFYHIFTIKSPLREVNEKLDIYDKGTLYLPISRVMITTTVTGLRRDSVAADNTAHWTMWSSQYTHLVKIFLGLQTWHFRLTS